jgi:hypothetical protein
MFFCKIECITDIWKITLKPLMCMKRILVLVCANLIAFMALAQKSKIKFGDVKKEDFVNVYEIDSSAEAVVLYDYGETHYEGNNQAYFNVVYTYHKRTRLLNKNSFDEATISIPLYLGSTSEERIEKLEAVTYTLEDGQVKTTKLDKGSIFKDKVNKNVVVNKFTFPNLKEGCIIEYIYTVNSPYWQQLNPWSFQGNHPVLWSEFNFTVPSIFDFVVFKNGYHPYTIDTVSTTEENYSIIDPGGSAMERSEVYNFKSPTYHSIWAMKNIPAIKRENYTTALKNHVSGIRFQLSSLRFPNQPVRPMLQTWLQVANSMLKNESFGLDLTAKNGWINDLLGKAIVDTKDSTEKAKKIFQYVRDNYTCTDHSAVYLTSTLKKLSQQKNGSVADINLLLTAMYKSQGFNAQPVVLGTTDNGKVYEAYPLMDQYNYVICQLKIDSTIYLLDASHSKLGFNRLPPQCYNGTGRIVESWPMLIKLDAADIDERKVTNVIISNDEKGGLKGSFTSSMGYYESFGIRESLGKNSTEDFFKNIRKNYSIEIELENTEIQELNSYDDAVAVKYDFKLPLGDEDVIYFNPMLAEGYKTNPFKSVARNYPVEMSYPIHETYVLTMQVPKGYKVDELPKSVRVKFNENEGMFEYIIKETDGSIQLRCKINLDKAVFPPDEYEPLRNFFAYIVKKQSEQIVFKKIQ